MGNKDNRITINNLLYALLFLVIGMMLLTTKESVLTIVSKVIGCVFITVGAVKTIVYIYMKGKVGDYRFNNLIIGLVFIFGGLAFIIFSGTLDWVIRVIIGLWSIFAGVNRMIFAFTYKKYDNEGFKVYLLTSLFMLVLGIVILSGILSQIIGVLIIIYSISEIFNYIYYKTKGKDIPKETKDDSKLPAVKSDKVVDAVIEEDNTK